MRLTRNQLYVYAYRGFESLPLRHISSSPLPELNKNQKPRFRLGTKLVTADAARPDSAAPAVPRHFAGLPAESARAICEFANREREAVAP